MPGRQRTAIDDRDGDGAGSGEGAPGVDGHAARSFDRAVDDQRALIDIGTTGIGVVASQGEGAGALLGERTDGTAVQAAVLNGAREYGRQIVAANRKGLAAEEDVAAAVERTDRRSG